VRGPLAAGDHPKRASGEERESLTGVLVRFYLRDPGATHTSADDFRAWGSWARRGSLPSVVAWRRSRGGRLKGREARALPVVHLDGR
jgi:hypothetical protein